MIRQPSRLDRLIVQLDKAVTTSFGLPKAARPYPGDSTAQLSEVDKKLSASLMRVNHAGEIAAQALYNGQSLAARNPETRQALQHAAEEEVDHLAWCNERLAELGSRPSRLAPFWYGGSFALGAIAGLLGDKTSLGFVAETERQVEAHLQQHLTRLPAADQASRNIVETMAADEARHGAEAKAAGGAELPEPVKSAMQASAKIMTTLAHHI